MNYKVVENILSNIYQFAFDNKIIVAVLWIAVIVLYTTNNKLPYLH